MNILVCISNVPDTTSKIEFSSDSTAFNTDGIQFIINPYDEFGLTKAIKLREEHGGKVTVVHMGTVGSEPTLRKALAIGADEAIRIDIEAKDSFTVAQELSKVITEHAFDLIIMGRESIDYNNGAVPGMLAAILDLPFVNACTGLVLEGSTAKMEREIEGGKEFVNASLPLILAGQKGLVEEADLIIPNMRGIMTARSKPLSVINPNRIDNKSISISFEKPAPKQACKMVEAGQEKELVSLLHQEAKVI
jgi:electron transfer flavoprotein beta subunit